MTSRRKFCVHCGEFVTLRTHRLHSDHSFLSYSDLYCHKRIEEVCSSEEEELAGDVFENVGHKAEDQEIEAASQGTKT